MARIHAMRHFFGLLIAVVFGFCAGGCAMQPPYGGRVEDSTSWPRTSRGYVG